MSTLNQSRNGPATVQLREAHPGPAHARAGVSEPARESPHRIGPRRPLVVVAVAVVVGLVAFAVWRLFLAPPAVAPGVIAVSGRIEGDDSAVAAKGSGRIREITVREGDRVEAGQAVGVLVNKQGTRGGEQRTPTIPQGAARGSLATDTIAAAQEFDREGARVAICGLNEGSLQAAKKTLGAGSLAVRADVSNLTDLDTMFATIRREFGHLDGVFVNAGYSESLLFEEVTEQSFDKVIAVNFKGAYFTIQKTLPLLRQGSSVIINASVGARKGWPTTSTVSTCKAAVVHLARILSAELVDRGIRVNTLSPGPTDTAMFGRFPGEEQGAAVKDVLRTNNPSKRMADPLEIAKLAVYLASDDSAYVVGADFLIDGGVTAISGVGA